MPRNKSVLSRQYMQIGAITVTLTLHYSLRTIERRGYFAFVRLRPAAIIESIGCVVAETEHGRSSSEHRHETCLV